MKRIAYIIPLLLILSLFVFRSHLLTLLRPNPHTYQSTQAAKEVGRYETIIGRVAEVSVSQSGTVFLDFDADYPNQSFTAVIPSHDVGRFVGLETLKDRTIEVTGKLDLYHGKPEIEVSSPRQISIHR